MWFSKTDNYSVLVKLLDLSLTESMVYQLAQSLPKDILYIIYINNLFPRVPILRKLRILNISIYRTT
jgi:hypothetical protein